MALKHICYQWKGESLSRKVLRITWCLWPGREYSSMGIAEHLVFVWVIPELDGTLNGGFSLPVATNFILVKMRLWEFKQRFRGNWGITEWFPDRCEGVFSSRVFLTRMVPVNSFPVSFGACQFWFIICLPWLGYHVHGSRECACSVHCCISSF